MKTKSTADRELLELAAKAAGLRHHGWIDAAYSGEHGGLHIGPPRAWNPLADDGDALRLAVKLKLGVETSSSGCEVRFDNQRGDEGCLVQEIKEDGSMSDLEATRRAIVLAAAEIGRLAE